MENIVNELIKLNQRDWFDIGTVVIPIILSVLIVIQNIHLHVVVRYYRKKYIIESGRNSIMKIFCFYIIHIMNLLTL